MYFKSKRGKPVTDIMVKKIKDIVYDINDVIIVMVILACAVLLIINRIEIIMAYPHGDDSSILLAEEEKTKTNSGRDQPDTTDSDYISDNANDASSDDNDDADSEQGEGSSDSDSYGPHENGEQQGSNMQPAPPTAEQEYPYPIYVAFGETAAQIAQKLLDAGIINDKNDFYDAIIAAGAERKLLAGSFTIPRNSSPDDVVRILTGG